MKALTADELSMQYLPVYVRGYRDDPQIAVLSCLADGVFGQLCRAQWIYGTLPGDPSKLVNHTKASPTEWRKVWPEIAPLFPLNDADNSRANPDVAALREDRIAFVESKRIAGRQGGRPRKHRQSTPTTEREPHGEAHGNHSESTQKPYGLADGNHTANHRETLGLGTSTQSPPPGGGGSFPPPPPLRLHGAARPELRPSSDASGEVIDTLAELPADAAARDAAVASIELERARAVVRRFFREQDIGRRRLESWIVRFSGWTAGEETTGGRKLPWSAIAAGLNQLLDKNPEGQQITPIAALVFVERFADAVAAVPGVEKSAARTGIANDAALAAMAIEGARGGDEEAIAYCRAHGIDFQEGAA